MSEHINNDLILIVEDEPQLGSLLEDYLKASGYLTKLIQNGSEVEPWLQDNQANLILLDLMLPGKNGLDICRDIRANSSIPIIMVTAKVEEIDRLLGLELGADDYVCKPYSPREIVARVKAVLRRFHLDASESQSDIVVVDVNSNSVKIGKIYNDYRVVSDRTVDSHIKKLRKKLQDAAPDHELIRSVYGAGYKYEPPEQE